MENGLKRMFLMKKNFGSKGKIRFLADTLAKISQNVFAYFSISAHSASFSLFQKKKTILVTGEGFPPPRPALFFKLFL